MIHLMAAIGMVATLYYAVLAAVIGRGVYRVCMEHDPDTPLWATAEAIKAGLCWPGAAIFCMRVQGQFVERDD